MSFVLHYFPGACSLAAHLVLEDSGQQFELVRVDLVGGSQRSAEFLAINPKGRVPVLQAGNNVVLTEVSAIMAYVAGLHPESALMPGSTLDMARAVEWCSWLGSAVHACAVAAVWRPYRFVSDEALFPAVSAKGKENLLEAYTLVEQRLTNTHWALGKHFSYVDYYLLVFYRWGYRLGLDMRADYPAWTRHAEGVCARRATGHVLAREGIEVWPTT